MWFDHPPRAPVGAHTAFIPPSRYSYTFFSIYMPLEEFHSVLGLSIGPSRAVSYRVPAHWVISGRSSLSQREPRPPLEPIEKQRRNTNRVISRYWQGVGWLWMRSRSRKVEYGLGKSMKFRQGFLTLTIPGVTVADHRDIKRLILDKFFTYCRNRLGLTDYVWTAELQKRGAIHFHAIVNTFMDKDRVRKAWIRACENSGIVVMSASGIFPSTEIELCKSYNGSKVYAAKYLGKALRSGFIDGRVWGGSHGVTGPKGLSTNELDDDFSIDAVLSELNSNGHVWRTFDHEVRISKVETQSVSKRKYPVIWRLLMNQLHAYDRKSAKDLHQSRHVERKPSVSRSRSVASNSIVLCDSANQLLSGHGGRSSSEYGQLLPISRMGIQTRPVGVELSLFPGFVEWGLRSGKVGRFRYSHDT